LAEPRCSPGEHIPLYSGTKLIPIRRNRFSTVERSASSLNFMCPSFVYVIMVGIVETLEQSSRNLGALVFGKA